MTITKTNTAIKASLDYNTSQIAGDALYFELKKLKDSSVILRQQVRKQAANDLWSLRKRLIKRSQELSVREIKKWELNNLTSLHQKYKASLMASSSDCLNLVKKIAQTIIGEHFNFDNTSLGKKISAAINRLANSKNILVYVNPSDIKDLYNRLSELHPENHIDLKISKEIPLGEAQIVSASGSVEISWQKHLDILVESLQHKVTLSKEGGYEQPS